MKRQLNHADRAVHDVTFGTKVIMIGGDWSQIIILLHAQKTQYDFKIECNT